MRFATETRVGIVVLLGAIVLTYMTFKVGGFQFREKGYRLFVVFPNVSGLDARAPVQVSGVEIGHVESVSLVEGGARITLFIRPDIEIKAGGFAAIRSSGLLGDRFVAIEPGKKPEIWKEGDTLPASSEGADIDQLTGQVADLITRFLKVTEDVQAITASLREAFGTEEGTMALKDILAHVRSLTRGIDEFVSANRGAIGRSISNLEGFSKLLKEEGEGLLKGLTRITQKIESGEGTIGKLIYDQETYDKLYGTLDRLGGSLKSVQSITERVDRGEGTIGKLFSDETAYENLNTALEGVSSTLGRIQGFKTEVGFRNEYQLDENENKGYFSIQLSPRQDKYYLLEVVDDPRGKISLTSRLTTENGTPKTVTELETARKMKLSALFGKRLPSVGLRIGLMENAFGIGTDLYSKNDRLRFSFDAWDFSSDDPLSKEPHLKISAQYDILRHIHFAAGYDQMLNSELDTLFVGAGLRFEDDDLKYLLGGFSGVAK